MLLATSDRSCDGQPFTVADLPTGLVSLQEAHQGRTSKTDIGERHRDLQPVQRMEPLPLVPVGGGIDHRQQDLARGQGGHRDRRKHQDTGAPAGHTSQAATTTVAMTNS